MRRIAVAGWFSLLACCCLAGTIRVEGSGSVRVPPDMMRFSFTVEAVDKDMAKAKGILAANNAKVMSVLKAQSVSTNEITVSQIEMRPKYHYENAAGSGAMARGEGKRVFDGYCHSMTYTLDMGIDRGRLEGLYGGIAACGVARDMDVGFYVKDSVSAKRMARQLAVRNARSVAEDICAAAGTSLGEVDAIHYSDGRNYPGLLYAKSEMARAGAADDAPLFPTIRVNDMEISDSVTIEWKLKRGSGNLHLRK